MVVRGLRVGEVVVAGEVISAANEANDQANDLEEVTDTDLTDFYFNFAGSELSAYFRQNHF